MALKKTGVQLVAEGADAFNKALDTAEKNVKGFGQSVQQAEKDLGKSNAAQIGQGFETFADKADKAGRSARIGLSAVGQTLDLVNPKLSNTIMLAGNLADSFGDVMGTLRELGTGFSVVAIGVAALGIFTTVMEQRNQAIAEDILQNDAFVQSMQRVAASVPEVNDKLKQYAQARAETQTGFSTGNLLGNIKTLGAGEMGQILRGADEAARLLGTSLSKINPIFESSAEKASRLKEELVAAADAFNQTLRAKTPEQNVALTTQKWSDYQARMEALHPILMQAARDESQLAQSTADAAFQAMQAAAAFAQQQQYASQMALEYKTEGEASNVGAQNAKKYKEIGEKWIADNQRAAQEWASKAEASIERQAQLLQGMVSKALAPTYPTAKEMEMAKAGKATPQHWDELARQAEDVALRPGTLEKYKNLQAALKETGLSAEAFAQGFRDMSLFADPANLKFADMGPVISSVEQQLKSMAGEANLTQEALKQVWANLSPAEKQTLSKAGIQSADDALKQLIDPAGRAKQQVAGLNQEIQQVPESKSTTFDNKKSTNFDSNLSDVLTDLNKIPAAADVVVTLTYQTTGASTTTGEPAAPAGGQPASGAFAFGGAGVTGPYGMWAYIHPREPYWMGGTSWDYPLPTDFITKSMGGISQTSWNMGQQLFKNAPNLGSAQDVQQWALYRYSDLRTLYEQNPELWDALREQYPGTGNNVGFYNAVRDIFNREKNPLPGERTRGAGGGGGGGGGSGAGGGGSMESGTIIIKGSATIVLDPTLARLSTGQYLVAPPGLSGGLGSVTINAPVTFPGLTVSNAQDVQQIGAVVRSELLGLRNNLLANRRLGCS